MQNVYAISGSVWASLFFSADLDPELHPFVENGVPLGALPHGMYLNPGPQDKHSTFGTLQEHQYIRFHDQTLLSSQNPNSVILAHDIDLSMRCRHNTMAPLFRRGLEALPQNGINIAKPEIAMKYLTVNENVSVNELTALLKEHGNIDYFLSLTCNQSMTPGVQAMYNQILEYIDSLPYKDDETVKAVFTAYAPRIVKAWERTVRWFFTWAQYSDELPLGRIKSYWYRYVYLCDTRVHISSKHGALYSSDICPFSLFAGSSFKQALDQVSRASLPTACN